MRNSVKAIPLTERERSESDRFLFQRFLSLPQLSGCPTIFLYYGVKNEPDTAQLIEPLSLLGKELALPRCLPGGQMEARRYCGMDHLLPGPFGVPEPDESCSFIKQQDLSLILVPGLCFDERGFRLGHGGGYYDRYLSRFSGLSVALCRDKLLFPVLPTETYDRPVNIVLTETRCLSHF